MPSVPPALTPSKNRIRTSTSPTHSDSPSTATKGWSTLYRHHIGVDMGGTMIKYAVEDTADGTPTTPILQLPTPVPITPQAVAEVLGVLLHQLSSRPQAPHQEANVGWPCPPSPARAWRVRPRTSTAPGSAWRSSASSPTGWAGPCTCSTTPTRPGWPRSATAPAADPRAAPPAAPCWSCSWAPGLARPCSSTDGWSRTWNWATSSSPTRRPRPGPRPWLGNASTWTGPTTPGGSSATSPTWSSCSPPA